MRHDKWAIPTLVYLLLVIIDNISVEVVEALLPRLILTEKRVSPVFVQGAKCEFRVVHVFHDAGIEKEMQVG
jgi:hypothetical protein